MQKNIAIKNLEYNAELSTQTNDLSQRVFLLQFLALAAFSVSGLYTLVYEFYFDYRLASIQMFFYCVLYFTAFILTFFNRVTFSRHLMVLNFLIVTNIHTLYLFPKEAGFQIYFIVGMPLIYMLFTTEQKIERIVYSSISVLSLLYMEFGIFRFNNSFSLPAEQLNFMNALNTTSSILVLSAAIYIFVNLLEKAEKESRLQATIDPLTQLFNRRHFFELSNTLLALSKRNGSPLSVAFLDLDNFKNINDEHGHEMGDTVLQIISNILKNQVRTTDIVARFGGEEFIILFSNSHQQHALNVCETIRLAIAEAKMPKNVNSITISIGVSELGDNDSINQAIIRADKALYDAKDKGRNQVIAF